MSSQIARKAQAMSMRTGTPICKHGMLAVYHPRQKQVWSDRGIFYTLDQQRPQRLSDVFKGLYATGRAMSWAGGLLDAISKFFTPKKPTAAVAEQPKVEQPKQEQPKVEQPKQEQPKVEQPKQEQPKAEEPKNDNEGAHDLYGIDGNETNVTKVNVIEFGGPYHYAQLYTYADGTPIPKDSADFKALYRALAGGENGIQEAGNQRVLQNEITLPSGKKVKIMADPNARIAQGFNDAKGGGVNKRYEVYQEKDGHFYLYNKSTNEKVYTASSRDACVTYAQQNGFTLEDKQST